MSLCAAVSRARFAPSAQTALRGCGWPQGPCRVEGINGHSVQSPASKCNLPQKTVLVCGVRNHCVTNIASAQVHGLYPAHTAAPHTDRAVSTIPRSTPPSSALQTHFTRYCDRHRFHLLQTLKFEFLWGFADLQSKPLQTENYTAVAIAKPALRFAPRELRIEKLKHYSIPPSPGHIPDRWYETNAFRSHTDPFGEEGVTLPQSRSAVSMMQAPPRAAQERGGTAAVPVARLLPSLPCLSVLGENSESCSLQVSPSRGSCRAPGDHVWYPSRC